MKPLELYDEESINKNEGKIEPFSLGIGFCLGIIVSAIQALIHYITNPDSVGFLGMAFINGFAGIMLTGVVVVCWIKYYSTIRKELLKVPEKVKK